MIDEVLDAGAPTQRQSELARALDQLVQRQAELGLTAVHRATIPFWDRPYVQPDPQIVTDLLTPIADPSVRGLPRGRGSVEQRTDNVDVLVDPRARAAAVAD